MSQMKVRRMINSVDLSLSFSLFAFSFNSNVRNISILNRSMVFLFPSSHIFISPMAMSMLDLYDSFTAIRNNKRTWTDGNYRLVSYLNFYFHGICISTRNAWKHWAFINILRHFFGWWFLRMETWFLDDIFFC